MKVYCRYCKHYRPRWKEHAERCTAETEEYHTYYDKSIEYVSPIEKNMKNNCKDFEEK